MGKAFGQNGKWFSVIAKTGMQIYYFSKSSWKHEPTTLQFQKILMLNLCFW